MRRVKYVMGKMKSNKQQNYTHRTLSPSLKDFSKAKSDYFLIPRTILVALLRSSFRETRKSDLTGPELRYIESPSSHNHRSPQSADTNKNQPQHKTDGWVWPASMRKAILCVVSQLCFCFVNTKSRRLL